MDEGFSDLPECFACGAPATTRDHVPPKGVFATPRPTNLITVPACDVCNQATKLDDEYFRWLVATVGDPTSESEKLIEQRILPRFKEQPALLRSVMSRARMVDFYSQGGIFLGRRPGFEYDRLRVQKVIAKTVRGLYLHEFGKRLECAVVRDFVLNPRIPDETKPVLTGIALRDVVPGVFGYRAIRAPEDDSGSLWLLMFFDPKALFLTITEPLVEDREGSQPDDLRELSSGST